MSKKTKTKSATTLRFEEKQAKRLSMQDFNYGPGDFIMSDCNNAWIENDDGKHIQSIAAFEQVLLISNIGSGKNLVMSVDGTIGWFHVNWHQPVKAYDKVD